MEKRVQRVTIWAIAESAILYQGMKYTRKSIVYNTFYNNYWQLLQWSTGIIAHI